MVRLDADQLVAVRQDGDGEATRRRKVGLGDDPVRRVEEDLSLLHPHVQKPQVSLTTGPVAMPQLVGQLTDDPRLKGSNPGAPCAEIKLEC